MKVTLYFIGTNDGDQPARYESTQRCISDLIDEIRRDTKSRFGFRFFINDRLAFPSKENARKAIPEGSSLVIIETTIMGDASAWM